jgi:hypothetical protein
MNYLSVCCIAKDEHPFIKEWIHHHLLVGAEKIIIFDNESSPSLRISLREYVQHGLVDLYEIPGKEQQMAAYDCCLKEYEGKSKWIAFIDVDEFLIPKKHNDVRMILSDYEDYGGLGVHWVEFGSSGHLTRPLGGQMRNYVHRFPLEHPKNMHIKSIVQPGRIKSACDPHKFIYHEPWFCVDENRFPLAESQGPFTARDIQLNHYYYRSQEDYCQKLDRGRADRADEEGRRRHEAFFPQLTRAATLDTWAVKHADDIDTLCPSFESLKKFMDSRQDGADAKKVLFSKILKYLAAGKTQSARILVKKLIVSQESRDVVDYLLHKIAQKTGNHAEALSALSRILQRNTEYSVCLEYAATLLEMKEYEACGRMLGFVRWKFAAALKTDAKSLACLSELDRKLEDGRKQEAQGTADDASGLAPLPPCRAASAAQGQRRAQ